MVEVRCNKCEELMELIETDSRQEWVEETYECEECDTKKIHKITFDQLGLVIGDEITDYEVDDEV